MYIYTYTYIGYIGTSIVEIRDSFPKCVFKPNTIVFDTQSNRRPNTNAVTISQEASLNYFYKKPFKGSIFALNGRQDRQWKLVNWAVN